MIYKPAGMICDLAPIPIAHASPSQLARTMVRSGDWIIPCKSFACLRGPLVLAGLALLVGEGGTWLLPGRRAFVAVAVMMLLFLHASRLAMVAFAPYLPSGPLAKALRRGSTGHLKLWSSSASCYPGAGWTRLESLGCLPDLGNLHTVVENGGQFLLANHVNSSGTEIQRALW
jgi:hypothetical protein